MHIVFVCSEFPLSGRPTGGIGSYVDNLSQALVKENIRVTIICQNTLDLDFMEKKRRIIAVSATGFPFWQRSLKSSMSQISRTAQFMNYPLGFSLKVASTLAKLHQETSIDIVEGADFGAELFFPLIFKIKAIRYVIKLHTPSFVIRQQNREAYTPFYQVLERMESFCIKYAVAVYSPTRALADIVTKKYQIKVQKIIPYPLPAAKISIGIKRDPNTILYVGKFQYKKGIFDLIDAIPVVVKQIPQSKFIFIGPDTLKDGISTKGKIMSILKSNHTIGAVSILDSLPQAKLSIYYQKASVLAVPSHWENFPNVLLEAGMYQVPVVASDTGGISEIINNGKTGLLVCPHRPRELAQAITTLIQKPVFAQKLAQHFYGYLSRHYSPQKVAKLTLTFYVHLLKSPTEE